MAFTRIAFNDTATYTGAYYVTLNPVELDVPKLEYSLSRTLDGPQIKQSSYYNNTLIKMRWKRMPQDFSNLPTMISTLNSYVDAQKYVHLGSADFGTPTLGWTLVRVVDVKVTAESGGAIKQNIELVLSRE